MEIPASFFFRYLTLFLSYNLCRQYLKNKTPLLKVREKNLFTVCRPNKQDNEVWWHWWCVMIYRKKITENHKGDFLQNGIFYSANWNRPFLFNVYHLTRIILNENMAIYTILSYRHSTFKQCENVFEFDIYF